ncbi:MAG: F0F1 ATP synthase subunit epsilon [bacterium]
MAEDKSFHCKVITPEREVFNGTVQGVVLPGAEGQFGVLTGHTPYLSTLDIGEIKVEQKDETMYVACSGEFVEISDNVTTVLAETAELEEEIDVERAKEARERALERLEKDDTSEIDEARARQALERAENRLAIVEE